MALARRSSVVHNNTGTVLLLVVESSKGELVL
jgi:hypothetical protein